LPKKKGEQEKIIKLGTRFDSESESQVDDSNKINGKKRKHGKKTKMNKFIN
jgi:hypothetical protein